MFKGMRIWLISTMALAGSSGLAPGQDAQVVPGKPGNPVPKVNQESTAKAGPIYAAELAKAKAEGVQKPVIQMAILLDTSGSMDGLIEQAKSQLWTIVNDLAKARQAGQTPILEVGLYEYGKSSIPAPEGYLRMILPLTTDLDKLSEELFKLRTNGGDEYCGKVIKAAVEGLNWSKSPDAMKVIFIAGNEPFTQGDVDYRTACKAAISKGIIVNTIHCGPFATGVATQWKDGALLADGQYMNIDQNMKLVHIETPYDKELAQLGVNLNKTYVRYTKDGLAAEARQEAQDANAAGASLSAAAARGLSKAGDHYRNDRWDLVDALREKKVKLEDVKADDLPEEMKKMSLDERKAHLGKMEKERTEMQAKIKDLGAKREAYEAAERRKLSEKGEASLDQVILKAVRSQAKGKKYEFVEETKPATPKAPEAAPKSAAPPAPASPAVGPNPPPASSATPAKAPEAPAAEKESKVSK